MHEHEHEHGQLGPSHQEPGIRRHSDIMQYWASKQHEYPIISQIARHHLDLPVTSAASEGVFSAGGGIITKKRNRLSPSTVGYLLCLRSWDILPAPDTSREEGVEEESEEDEKEVEISFPSYGRYLQFSFLTCGLESDSSILHVLGLGIAQNVLE